MALVRRTGPVRRATGAPATGHHALYPTPHMPGLPGRRPQERGGERRESTNGPVITSRRASARTPVAPSPPPPAGGRVEGGGGLGAARAQRGQLVTR